MNAPEPPLPRRPGQLPAAIRRQRGEARRQEWTTLALRLSAVAALYAALGGSQALHAIWLKSLWALLPPVAFLAADRIEDRPPTRHFPYGFYRAGSIAFLTAALALTGMGLYLLAAASHALVVAQHPALPPIPAGGRRAHWPGWWILAALAWSAAVPWIMGSRRRQLAIALHDKGLYADTAMGRVNWLAAGAALIGVLGIGFGIWWIDYAAALFIGLDVLRHGAGHLTTAVADLMDEMPRRTDSRAPDPLAGEIQARLRACDWVGDARVRLREQGRRLTGVALIRPYDETASLARLEALHAAIESMDWRLLDFQLVPVGGATFDHLCIDAPQRWA